MFIPIIVLLISAGFLGYRQTTEGKFIDLSIELKGGKLITVQVETDLTASEIESQLQNANIRISQGQNKVLMIETSEDTNENELLNSIKNVKIIGEPTVNRVGSTLSEVFYQKAQQAVIIAFVLMAIVVFFLFRKIAPSIAVLFAGVMDIVVTFSVLSFLGVRLSLTIIAGLLMLIGYSIDSDILLTTRVLKRKGKDIEERIKSSMKTGLTMTITTLAALSAMYLFSTTPVIQTIAMVLIIGLLIDIPATYLTNVGILRLHLGE